MITEKDSVQINTTLNNVLLYKLSETTENLTKVFDFLYEHESECMFLIGNLESFGPSQTDHPNSGDFYIIESNSSIICVFCLCKSGIFLIYSDSNQTPNNILSKISEKIILEKWNLTGLIGEESISSRFFLILSETLMKSQNLSIILKNKTRNILLDLKNLEINTKIILNPNHSIRNLHLADFTSWNQLITDFSLEIGIQVYPIESQLKVFEDLVSKNHIWGYFVGDELVSTVRLNSVSKTGGSIGGVFTQPRFRRQGLAKFLIQKLISDCGLGLKFKHLSLFTEVINYPAINLYKSLDFIEIGFYEMDFFSIPF